MIYAVECVFARLEKDGKWHLKSNIESYGSFDEAKKAADARADFGKDLPDIRVKFVKVWTIEPTGFGTEA